MARYKVVDRSPKFLPVVLSEQLLPGTFEHALNHLLDHELDLSGLDERFCNDATGAPAYPPAVLLKLILFAYSRGIVSSRAIERACREHVTFIALCGDQAPHFTTLAAFIRELHAWPRDRQRVHPGAVHLRCSRTHWARDVRHRRGEAAEQCQQAPSGTRAEFERQADKIEGEVRKMLARHRDNDGGAVRARSEGKRTGAHQSALARCGADSAVAPRQPRRPTRGKGQCAQEQPHRQRVGQDGHRQRRDPGLHRGGGGGCEACQIIVEAQAHGTGSEQALLMPVVEAMRDLIEEDSIVTADAGYHSEENLEQLAKLNVEALIADKAMRKRDPRFAEQAKHKAKPDPLWDKTPVEKKARLFGPKDFHYDEESKTCICPAGEFLYQNGSRVVIKAEKP